MYAKLINNILHFAPYYLNSNDKLILNPQGEDYLSAGYKEVQCDEIPKLEAGQELITTYNETENKIIINYSVENIIKMAAQREEEFYNNFIPTSLGNFRTQPKGYQSAIESLNTAFNIVTTLGKLPKDTLIFYATPDFSDPNQCTETWLVEHQFKNEEMTVEQFSSFYTEFILTWNNLNHKGKQENVFIC